MAKQWQSAGLLHAVPVPHTHPAAEVTGLAAVATSGQYADLAGKPSIPAQFSDLTGVLPTSALPALSITDTFTVASQAAMLALDAQRGDVAVRSDLGSSWILVSEPASTLANWTPLPAAGKVQSVNGQQGIVILSKADIGLGNVDNTADSAKPVSTAQQSALDLKLNASARGAANGVASLDASTKVPFAQLPTGSTSTTVVVGNDSRLSNARTPTAHAASHASGGSDDLSGTYALKTYADAQRGLMLTASSVGTRPASPVTGQQIFRTDKGFVEQWDGTAWRVRGIQIVSATSDITDPVLGQRVIVSSQAYRTYQWGGGSWGMVGNAQAIGGEWQAAASQNLPVGTTKLAFANTLVASSGITFNGTDTWTILSEGVYDIHANARKAAASTGGDALHVTPTTYSDATLILPGVSANGYGEQSTSGSVWLAEGAQICVHYYNGQGASSTAYGTRPPRVRIWKKMTQV